MVKPNFASGTIWTGDNLRIMRGINSDCIDLIYLDPPFNSDRTYSAPIGSDAAGASFKDAWTLSDLDEFEHGELAESNEAAATVVEAAGAASGSSMKAYLIFMAVRLLEIERILKPEGSVYLHCDDTAGHWLRCLMDAIFGRQRYQNEIIWQRTSSHNDPGRFGRVADRLLFYGENIHRDAARVPLKKKHVESKYTQTDNRGRYRTHDLTGPGTSDGESGESWSGWDPTNIGRCWSVPRTGEYAVWIDAKIIPGYLAEPSILARLELLKKADMIVFSSTGTPSLKRYLEANPGQIPVDIWTDIPPVNSQAAERTGYPTQKPLDLLRRIIKSSSRDGDLVFDPFCGCATSLVAADQMGRQWAGVDLSPLAIELVNKRIAKDRGLWGGATALEKPPSRDDTAKLPNYRTHRHYLYGIQEGVCAGCDTHFPFRVMDVDHKIPISRGGTDHLDNLQLLCSGCNRSKGGRTMAEWRKAQADSQATAKRR